MIDYYILKHHDGITFYYENNSPRFRLEEYISFDLENCRIEGVSGDNVFFILNPRERYLVNIVKDEYSCFFDARISNISFQVVSENEQGRKW